jgi:bifunctional N-acetylglucosamine-1-phosphate-uridyltransferase/glucosamine-1-phosphate-acetyltransferase GlmU-like protein
LIGIVEEKDADEDQKRINIINSGIYIVKKHYLIRFLPKIRANNKQAELYLTDIVGLGYRNGIRIGAFVGANNEEILGVNNPSDLQEAENIMIIRTNEKT